MGSWVELPANHVQLEQPQQPPPPPQQQLLHLQLSVPQQQELLVSFHSHTWVQPTQVAQMLGDFRHHGAAQKLINMETISLATTETVMSTRVLLPLPHLPHPLQVPLQIQRCYSLCMYQRRRIQKPLVQHQNRYLWKSRYW